MGCCFWALSCCHLSRAFFVVLLQYLTVVVDDENAFLMFFLNIFLSGDQSPAQGLARHQAEEVQEEEGRQAEAGEAQEGERILSKFKEMKKENL